MGPAHYSCCVVNCGNTGQNSQSKFYRFPMAHWKLEQRDKWIAAVNRKNCDGTPWYPTPSHVICSDHFIGGKKSEEEASPSYLPTIFLPSGIHRKKGRRRKKHGLAIINRYSRLVKIDQQNSKTPSPTPIEDPLECSLTNDQECQVSVFTEIENVGKTFICNRYIYVGHAMCDVEIQTEMEDELKKEEIEDEVKMENPSEYHSDGSHD